MVIGAGEGPEYGTRERSAVRAPTRIPEPPPPAHSGFSQAERLQHQRAVQPRLQLTPRGFGLHNGSGNSGGQTSKQMEVRVPWRDAGRLMSSEGTLIPSSADALFSSWKTN
jgi:hypothetical protein